MSLTSIKDSAATVLQSSADLDQAVVRRREATESLQPCMLGG